MLRGCVAARAAARPALLAGAGRPPAWARHLATKPPRFQRKRRRGGRRGAAAAAPQQQRPPAPPAAGQAAAPAATAGLGTDFNVRPHTPPPRLGAYETAERALRTLAEIHEGIKDMESSNEGLAVSFDETEGVAIEIPGHVPTAGEPVPGGTYSLHYNASKEHLVLFSPFDQRVLSYELNPTYDAWTCVEDGHQLLELLMRHMTGRLNGYPAF